MMCRLSQITLEAVLIRAGHATTVPYFLPADNFYFENVTHYLMGANIFLSFEYPVFFFFQITRDLRWMNRHMDQNWWANYKGIKEGPVRNPFQPKLF